MARPLRLEFPGATWHVTSRGNERRAIVRDDDDRATFVRCLADAVTRARWRLHGWVLMDNHYHLLLDTPEPTLSVGMHRLNSIYTQSFNRRHGRSGHLLQGRFRGILVEREAHLLELIRYVVLNPVRANMTSDPADHPWCSYRATAGLRPVPDWLCVGWTLEQFDGSDHRRARLAYRRFVAEGAGAPDSPWEELRGQIYLGSDAFLASVRERCRVRAPVPDVPRAQLAPLRTGIAPVLRAVCEVTRLQPSQLRETRAFAVERGLFAWLARRDAEADLRTIGEYLSVSPAGARRCVARLERGLSADRRLRRLVARARASYSESRNQA